MPSGTLIVEDCLDCCPDECPEDGDWELTVNGATECSECRVTVNPVFRYKVLDASPVIDAFVIPVTPPTSADTITTVVMTEYSDVCVTVDSEPDADVNASISCADGVLTVSITVDIPNSLEPLTVEVFQGTGAIGEVIVNTLNCASGQLPFFITSVTILHAL